MAAPMAWAQCEPGWEVGITDGLPDFDDAVTATLNWDPDGAGPEPEMMVFGGQFLNAGNLGNVNHIVGWDGTRWIRFGAGLPRDVIALGSYRGELVASYNGYKTGQGWMDGISKWNGTGWEELRNGLTSGTAAKLLQFGDVLLAAPQPFADFEFETAPTWGRLAQWTGDEWRKFPDPPDTGSPGNVFDMTLWNGRLVIAGFLVHWVGAQYTEVGAMEWNPPWWTPLGTNTPKSATTLGQYGGDLYVGSADVHPNRVTGSVQRWNGQAWSVVGSRGNDIDVRAFTPWNGGIVAAGAVWDGAQWASLPPSNLGQRDRWCALGDELIELGDLAYWPETYRFGARLDDEQWKTFGGGPVGNHPSTQVLSSVYTVCAHDGRVFVGGVFHDVGGQPIHGIAEWTRDGWTALGEQFTPECAIEEILSLNGELVVIGEGLVVESTMEFVGPVARWDGAHWQRLGTHYAWYPRTTIHRDALYAYSPMDAEEWCLARWDDPEWAKVWEGEVDISALASFGDDVVAFGNFTTIGGVAAKRAARWDGAAWRSMGAELQNGPREAIVHAGELFAAGSWILGWQQNVARWDGAAWQAASAGILETEVENLTEWNGVMLAATTAGVYRWNGASWDFLFPVVRDASGHYPILDMAPFGDTLLVGGKFQTTGDRLSVNFARWREPVAPSIGAGPVDVVACRGGDAEFSVSASGSGPIAYQWRRDGAPLVDGTTAGGAMISGAQSAVLSIAGLSHADAGLYDCTTSNPCGQAASAPALLAVCSAELDCNGFVNGQDFDLFVELFSAANIGADVDGDGFVTGEDFDQFVGAFEAGC